MSNLVTMGSKPDSLKESIAGHQNLDDLNIQKLCLKIGDKIKENLITGRFYPETEAEKRFLREYKEANKKKLKW